MLSRRAGTYSGNLFSSFLLSLSLVQKAARSASMAAGTSDLPGQKKIFEFNRGAVILSRALLLFALFYALAPVPFAMAAEDAVICPADRINSNGNICTASDVQLAAAAVGNLDAGLVCFPGEDVEVAVSGTVNLRKGDRFDIGIWISTDGKSIELRGGSNGAPDEGGAQSCEVLPLPFLGVPEDGTVSPNIIDSFDDAATPQDCYDTSAADNGDTSSGRLITSDRDAIVEGKVDVNNDGVIDGTDNSGVLPIVGFHVFAGLLDMDDDGLGGEINGDDDGIWNGFAVENGIVDVDGDGVHGEIGGDDDSAQTFNDRITVTCIAGPTGELLLSSLVTWNVPSDAANVCDPTNPDTYSADWNSSKCSVNNSEIAVDIVGKVTVVKSAPAASGESFQFTYTNSHPTFADSDNPDVIPDISAASPFNLMHSESAEIFAVIGNRSSENGPFIDATVVIDESTLPAGWSLSSINCTGDDLSATVIDLANNRATVTLRYNDADPAASQDDVTCTFNNSPPGSITVEKQTDPDGSPQNFDFDVNGNPVNLTDGGTHTISDLPPGTYTATEAVPAGWALTGISCDDGNSTGDVVTATATFNVESGEDVTCTFNNAQAGTIIVEKQTDPDGSAQTFGFIGNAAGTISDGGQIIVSGLAPGQYISQEVVPAGWTLTSISCDDGNSSGNAVSGIATFNLEAGETVTCKFTNTIQSGNIVVQKLTDPDTSTQTFDFTASYDADGFTLGHGDSDDSGPLLPSSEGGTYSVSETVPAGWIQPLPPVCDDGSPLDAIDLAPGETVTCLFGNTQLGTIIVEKQTDPDGSAQTFGFVGDAAGTISDGGQIIVSGLVPGQYISQETVPAGWTLTSISCNDDNSSGNTVSGIATFNLEAGETVTCTFGNLEDAPSISLIKTGTLDDGGDGIANAGDTIDYTFTVENTGNVTLNNVSVTDPLPGLSAITCPSGNPIPALAVGATEDCTASYTLTQADIDSGQVDNTATADSDETEPVTSSETVPLDSAPALELSKTGTLDDGGDGIANAGDTIDYTFTVENTGNVTLNNVSVTDPLPGLSAITCPSGNPIPALAVGATEDCTASYTLTQADIDSGQVDNTATADSDETEPVTSSETVPLDPAPALELSKTGTLDDGGDGIADVGDTITYVFTVENTGNVTLTKITITDPLVTVSGGPIASLAPGATDSTTFTASYVLTQPDIDAGSFTNTATANSDEGASDDDSDTQILSSLPVTPPQPIPVLNPYSLVLMVLLMMGFGVLGIRARR